MSQEPGDSPEDPSFREFLGICDPALLMLLGEYVSRLIPKGEEAPRLRSMRLHIALESMERLRGKEPEKEFSRGLRELWPMIGGMISRYAELLDSAESEPGPGEEAV